MGSYTQVDNVKKVLRSSTGQKAIMSDDALVGVSIVSAQNRNISRELKFNSEYVTVETDFVGKMDLQLEFTSPTDYSVYLVTTDNANSLYQIGSSSISSTFSHESIQVSPGTVSGDIEIGDKILLKFHADISIDDVEEYICETELIIDSMLEHGFFKYRDSDTPDDNIYPCGSVPPQIKYTAKYLAAYYIYTDTFAEIGKENASDTYSFTSRWKKRAESFLLKFIKTRNRSTPFVSGFPIKIERSGVKDVASGLELMNETYSDMSDVDTKDDEIFERMDD